MKYIYKHIPAKGNRVILDRHVHPMTCAPVLGHGPAKTGHGPAKTGHGPGR